MGGLTTGLLRHSFYDQYTYQKATVCDSGSSMDGVDGVEGATTRSLGGIAGKIAWRLKQANDTNRPGLQAELSSKLREAGQRRGVRVDNNLDLVCALKLRYRLPECECGQDVNLRTVKNVRSVHALREAEALLQRCAGDDAPRLGDIHLRADAKKLLRVLRARDPHTRLVCSYLHHAGLRLWATQVHVGVAAVCGTSVDAVCLNARNEIVLVEVKTGGDSYLDKHTGVPMSWPFQDQTDSVLNQYSLQLAFTEWLYLKSFPQLVAHHGKAQSCIVRVNKERVVLHPLPEWASSRVDSAVAVLRRFPAPAGAPRFAL